MSFTTRFTEDEQVLLSTLPMIVGSAVAMAEGSGLGTVKEMFANSQSFLAGSKNFPNNEIISGILPNMQNVGEALDSSKELRGHVRERLQSHQVKSKEQIRELAINDAKAAAELLTTKAESVEADSYKAWVLDIADDIANAAKEGGFLGFGGTRVSEGEQQILAELRTALGVA